MTAPVTRSSDSDQLTRFVLDDAGVRAVHVQLDETWQHIRTRADYGPTATDFLGQVAVASALFTGHAKVDGRLSVQLRGDGAVRTVFAECTAAGTLRGIAQLSGEEPIAGDLSALGADPILAITIENPPRGSREPSRYQGLVALVGDGLSRSFEAYFAQSEQLPTRLLLAVNESRAAGMMLQKLPGDEGDEDGWTRASSLFDTLGPHELLALPGAEVARRLFHEDDVRMVGTRSLSFACSCSRARVEAMLLSLGREEAEASVVDDAVTVHCEFCGETYRLQPTEIDRIFARDANAAGPDRAQ